MTELHWRDYPQLFANGKFKSLVTYGNGEQETQDIDVYCLDFGDGRGETLNDIPIRMNTLIARHIDDMTDEEWETSNLMRKRSKEMRLKWLKTVVLSAEDMLYLLSIGVYPFKWPTDGSVVDMNTLKEEEWVGS